MAWVDPIKRALVSSLAKKQAKGLQDARAAKTPAMRQHEYEVARKSMLGEFSSYPPTVIQECIANAKAARRKERLELVNRHMVSCPDHAKQAADLRQDMDEVESMRCAKHVYLANDPDAPAELRDNPPPGFKKATPEQLDKMGLNEDMLSPGGSNFRAAVYIKDPNVWGSNPKPEAVLAFRGSTPDKEDWDNNFGQDANSDAPYYKRAVQIGNILAKYSASIQLVGHSLGGGLASAAQGGSGLTASTYNAAGLHPDTVTRYSTDIQHVAADPGNITAIRLQGEVLTKTQETGITGILANKAVGIKRDLSPSHDEEYFQALKDCNKINTSDNYPTYLHGMDEIIDSTEKKKSEDETALKECAYRRSR